MMLKTVKLLEFILKYYYDFMYYHNVRKEVGNNYDTQYTKFAISHDTNTQNCAHVQVVNN